MAKDDYFVIVYQVLWYLYDCLKKNQQVDAALLSGLNFSIPETYWDYILRSLVNEGYVTGVAVMTVLGSRDGLLRIEPNVKITPKGIQYLYDNSLFQKVKRTLQDVRSVLPV
jgi:hypothetical protein